MLVSLYYLTLWYPLPKLQPKGKTKEPQHDIHDSKREVQIQAPTVDRKQWPPQTGQLNEMRHRDRASNLSSRNFQSLMRQSRCLIYGFPKWNLPSARSRSCVKDGRAPGRRPTRGGSWVPQILSLAAERNARLFLPYRYGWRQLPRGLGAKTIRFRGPPK